MENKFSTYSVLLFILIASLAAALAYMALTISHGIMTGIVEKAFAQETAEERAHEENENVENGFSPVNPESAKQVTSLSENTSGAAINLSPNSLIQSGAPLLGKPSAPITIVEFGDFQCEFCDRFAKQTEPKINSTYIQTGKVNMIFMNFVTHGPDSLTAAMAAQCAKDQGKFWSFYNILYKNQGPENSGWASANNLKKFASQISGVDKQNFNSCLDSSKYKSIADRDTALAISSGFQGTPTFVIEKADGSKAERLLGAYPFPSFQAIIDTKLSEVK
jgi:protein-disulfide isomerase